MDPEKWKDYEADFNTLSDLQIEKENLKAQMEIEDAEDWLEAVASWEAAGRPRK